MVFSEDSLGLDKCHVDPHDPNAVKGLMEAFNQLIDIVSEFKYGGRPLLNEEGTFIRDGSGNIIRIPWWLSSPDLDLPGLRVRMWPPGIIVAWSGYVHNIPVGWTLCDGANQSPDLQEHFIRGAGPASDPALSVVDGSDDHGGGTNDHTAHSPPGDHTVSLNLAHTGGGISVTVDPHTDTLNLAHTGGGITVTLDPHTETLGHSTVPDHVGHTHPPGECKRAVDTVDGTNSNVNPDEPATTDPATCDCDTVSHVHTFDMGAGDFWYGGLNCDINSGPDTPTTNREHGEIDSHFLNLVHTVYTTHTNPNPHGDALNLQHTVSTSHTNPNNHTDSFNLTHTFDGSHSGTDNRPVFMSLCWIMKLAEVDQVFPDTPFS